jgi:poly-beta-1,6-N-acetyl-D-glucosamine synthase
MQQADNPRSAVLEYVLITPARNEAEYIEATIQSVVSQTRLPKRWVIVSDGSSDGTDDIVRRYMAGRDWMVLVHLPNERKRSFAAKVDAFNAGLEAVKNLPFQIIGCLDADITFVDDYFEFLLTRFAADPTLGVAGTHYVEDDFHSYEDSYINVQHVNGGVQLFRKACFEQIGGYIPIQGGGIDWVAVTTARMNGWKTYSFDERVFHHHRKIGTAGTSELISRFRYGQKDYFLGGHPLWEVFRGVYQMSKKPFVIGGVFLLAGYFWCWITRFNRPISQELVAFHRKEQLARLRGLLFKRPADGRRLSTGSNEVS